MAGNIMEHTQEREEYRDELEETREKALVTFLEKVNEKDSKLLSDIATAATPEADKSQLSWATDDSLKNCINIYHTVRDALKDVAQEEREYVSQCVAHALMQPAGDHVNHKSPRQEDNYEETRNKLAQAIQNEKLGEFGSAYKRMEKILQDDHGHITWEEQIAEWRIENALKVEAAEGKTQDDAAGNQSNHQSSNQPNYREVLKEETDERLVFSFEKTEAPDATGSYRELLKEESTEKYKQTPLEQWNNTGYPESMEAYLEQAEGQLKILSDKPANMTTFILNMKEKITGKNQFGNGYDLKGSERAEATHNLMENLRDAYPDMVRLIAQGKYPDLEGQENFTGNDVSQQNKALWNAFEKTVEDLQTPGDDYTREHLRHTVTQIATHSTEEVMENFKQEHQGWKPESFEDEMEETKSLVLEASRLEKAAADIGWGPGRELENPMWKQIRQDIFMKEIEVGEAIKKNLFHPRK